MSLENWKWVNPARRLEEGVALYTDNEFVGFVSIKDNKLVIKMGTAKIMPNMMHCVRAVEASGVNVSNLKLQDFDKATALEAQVLNQLHLRKKTPPANEQTWKWRQEWLTVDDAVEERTQIDLFKGPRQVGTMLVFCDRLTIDLCGHKNASVEHCVKALEALSVDPSKLKPAVHYNESWMEQDVLNEMINRKHQRDYEERLADNQFKGLYMLLAEARCCVNILENDTRYLGEDLHNLKEEALEVLLEYSSKIAEKIK